MIRGGDGRAGGGIRSLARWLCPRPNIAYKRSKYVDVHDVEKCVYCHLWLV
jgi:hypothetical protein